MVNKDFEKSAVKHADSNIFSKADIEEIMGAGYERALPEEETVTRRLKRLFGISTGNNAPLALTYRANSEGGRKLGDTMTIRDNYGDSTYMNNLEGGILGHRSISRYSGGARRGVGPVGLVRLHTTREGPDSFSVSGGFKGLGLKRGENISTRDEVVLTMQVLANIQRSIANGEDFDYEVLREELIDRGYGVDEELTTAYLKDVEINGLPYGREKSAEVDAPQHDDTEPA